jgi:hypothetical protein
MMGTFSGAFFTSSVYVPIHTGVSVFSNGRIWQLSLPGLFSSKRI